MGQSPLLKIDHLSVKFNTKSGLVHAVDNLSISLESGKTMGIVGESGSGKSVTSLAVLGLLPTPPALIDKQSSILFTTDLQEEPIQLLNTPDNTYRKIRGREIAMIFQEPMTALNPVYTCGRQICEAIAQHTKSSKNEIEEQALELFNEVLIPRPEQTFKAYPHQLSGGQRQRVMIAMAMSCRPKLLIADEPTTALDVTVQKHILELLQQLQEKYNMSMLFITHDLGVIADIAHDVTVMYKGKMVEQGKATDVFNNPQHPYTKGLLACKPPLHKQMHHLPTVADFMHNEYADIQKIVHGFEKTTEIIENQHANQQPILHIENLKTYYTTKKSITGKILQQVKALDDVSLHVYKGETLGIVGESGCGKTTLGRTILALQQSTGGTITYKKQPLIDLIREDKKAFRKSMQIVFQDPYSSLNPYKTIGSAIQEPMQVHHLGLNEKDRQKRVCDLLKKVGLLEEHYNRYPHEFSGGQRQRVCIARALAVEPEFIVCDESVSALDVSVQAQVLNLLNDLKQEFGFTYIFISHDLSVVKHMSDKIIVMRHGKVVEAGTPDNIFYHSKEEYTKQLIDAIPGQKNEWLHSSKKTKPSLTY